MVKSKKPKKPISRYVVTITYINAGGFECKATIKDPERIHHIWYSARRNSLGKFEKHEVTILGAFLAKLRKDCSKIKAVMNEAA